MKTPETDFDRDLAAQKLDAEAREVEAKLRAIQAQVNLRKAQAETDEITRLAAAKDRVKTHIADFKKAAPANYAAAKSSIELEINDLKANIQRASEKYGAKSPASSNEAERRFDRKSDDESRY
jgi:hypothetical protein